MDTFDNLLQKGVITKEQAAEIQQESLSKGLSVEAILIERGLLSKESKKKDDIPHFNSSIPRKNVNLADIAGEVLEYIPEESALHYRFVPLGIVDGVLEVGLTDPNNTDARDALNFISSRLNLPYKIFLITEDDFNKVIALYKGLSGEVTRVLSEIEREDEKSANTKEGGPVEILGDTIQSNKLPTKKKGSEVDVRVIEDAPITKIVATVLRYATEGGASDVHIEHMKDSVRVRFRVDGILNTSLVLPKKVHSAVIARIKILANMRLDEKRRPQDGRFPAKIDGRKVDFRVSTFPAYYGEKIVMRILDQEKGIKLVKDLGLSDVNLKAIERALKKPYGLVLVSGPTGSGKTTTLYSMINELDREAKNVLSLEDPIEYNIEGMSQSQVRPEIGYTFASGLRTTLRQDPDIIMVGEIRDKETAQLAIQAALTGHLVFSTIHTNNAFGVIPRLVDMGVDPYLIAPTLTLTIAQRLLRTLCDDGGKKMPVSESMLTMVDKQFGDLPEEFRLKLPKPEFVYEATPTSDCPLGVRGRTAAMEVLEMDSELEHAILTDPTELNIQKIARKKGMLTMKEDAMLKSFAGIIPFEEVNKL
jgi:type IV pilus assembly protein PilB